MHGDGFSYGYGFWSLVIVNVLFFLFFILSFLAPVKRREWRSMGVATAFIIALFTEMYGFPLTIYILTAVLGAKYPSLNPFSHESGHLWATLLGGGQTMLMLIHLVSNGLMIAGFLVMASGWRQVHGAKGELVTTGLYSRVRHPQYSGLFLVTIGLLVQWPTIITAVMWPVLLFAYYRLAKNEEEEMERGFGEAYRRYREEVPMFIPKIAAKK
ncbi:MAG TPA: isoprenylcysteine carboxyl methyltransferase [Deltaproteobacteria bacterium]|nr:MAG: isoprenylcysteine carboxyl methyltransferase [Deltaproteobacteria bacterium GWA2_55_82]OGQ64865.1 MAG: isoprenylcysteine carboxyl methyltransferase [Deltaproteobacteria bacterium RIFCSPLOWO2_02_FULL_55_12]OIJ73932.1 MAG: isoprenylcysteine carboxyl methyltransferase [Deltaproteobacteria bacterium GWC2_55_46]HBG46527.1 isoprenylcysteine carboxyl methyltransferase [Deltaproteobacteria bacterium]HCY09929.1 isoprenylcysteine carboxyl methyltransferase [Deltaproteobacteria bacterium]